MIDQALDQLLRELEAQARENDARVDDYRRRFLNLERPTAELMYLLVQATRRQRLLEIGTSNGYSTIWLAAALRHDGEVRLTTIDRSADKLALARHNLERAGLSQVVEFIEGKATDVVRSLNQPFDCVFFDADRVTAPAQLEILLPKLPEDVLLLSDNVLSHPEEIAGYRNAVEQLYGFIFTVVPVGKGLHIAWRGETR